MAAPSFWDNQETAQQTIQKFKPWGRRQRWVHKGDPANVDQRLDEDC